MWSWLEGVYRSLNIAETIIGFVMSTVSFVSLMHGMWRAPAQGPQYVKRFLLALAAYIASGIFIIAVVTRLTGGRSCPDVFALPAVALIFLWIALSVLWLIRVLATEKSSPMWFLKPFSMLDWVLIGAIAVDAQFSSTARPLRCGGHGATESILIAFEPASVGSARLSIFAAGP
jgi:hypothetical protein